MPVRPAVRHSLVAVVAAATALTLGSRPALAQTFDANATTTLFTGCDTHLCATLTRILEPADLTGSHPPGVDWAAAFSVTFTFLGNGAAVGWIGASTDISVPGIPLNQWFESFGVLGLIGGTGCPIGIYQVSGTCTEDAAYHRGYFSSASSPFAPGTASIRYYTTAQPGPTSPTNLPTGSFVLRLQEVTAPEPATLALVAGGLLVLGVGARRRRT